MIGPIFGGLLFLMLNNWYFGVPSIIFGILFSILSIIYDSPIKNFICDNCKMNEVRINEERPCCKIQPDTLPTPNN